MGIYIVFLVRSMIIIGDFPLRECQFTNRINRTRRCRRTFVPLQHVASPGKWFRGELCLIPPGYNNSLQYVESVVSETLPVCEMHHQEDVRPSVASADHRILHTVVGENVLMMLQFLSGCCWHILLRLVSGPEEICGIVNEQILQ